MNENASILKVISLTARDIINTAEIAVDKLSLTIEPYIIAYMSDIMKQCNLKELGWKQYTPDYRNNDSHPFSIRGVYIKPETSNTCINFEDIDDELSEEHLKIVNDFDNILHNIEPLLERKYGDGYYISMTKDNYGKLYMEELF